MISPLYTPRPGDPMRVGAFMSGSGTNLVKILERQLELEAGPGGCPFRVAVLFTDNPGSNAGPIGERFRLPVVVQDIIAFYRDRGREDKKDLSLWREFDREAVERLAPFALDALVLAGYMSVVTRPLLEAFPGRIVNVHPADLRVLAQGRRKYTGDQAVRDAILAGEPFLHATTHLVRQVVDGGEILMVSPPVRVELPSGCRPGDLAFAENREALKRLAAEHQERLKQAGDWVILPRTLEWLARGRYALDESGRVLLDGELLQP